MLPLTVDRENEGSREGFPSFLKAFRRINGFENVLTLVMALLDDLLLDMTRVRLLVVPISRLWSKMEEVE